MRRLQPKTKAGSLQPSCETPRLMSVAVDYQNGVFAGTNSLVKDLTGTPPMTVEAFVRKHVAKFD
jgi:NAD(P)H dehydrogenase (quinone)